MSTGGQRSALIVGIILILIGLLFLLPNWLPDFSFWYAFGRYWPILLILIGLRKLYFYFTYTPEPVASYTPEPAGKGDAVK